LKNAFSALKENQRFLILKEIDLDYCFRP
jgi:hypothetical protein